MVVSYAVFTTTFCFSKYAAFFRTPILLYLRTMVHWLFHVIVNFLSEFFNFVTIIMHWSYKYISLY